MVKEADTSVKPLEYQDRYRALEQNLILQKGRVSRNKRPAATSHMGSKQLVGLAMTNFMNSLFRSKFSFTFIHLSALS